eukprot:SAG31_NODE_1047_length_10174_cov_3.130819_4_plen_116_part_00
MFLNQDLAVQVTQGGHVTLEIYPVQEVADMLGLSLDQMAMLGSLVENDFMKHSTHLKEFHYRIGGYHHLFSLLQHSSSRNKSGVRMTPVVTMCRRAPTPDGHCGLRWQVLERGRL